jgi:relaxase-like protein
MKSAGRRDMPKRSFSIPKGEPLLDVASFGRGGPHGAIGNLTPEQIEHIRLTVRRAPEVMVKVLPRATNDLKAVGKHIDYIGRKGALDLETDDGEILGGRIGPDLVNDWDLDIDDVRRQTALGAMTERKPSKLVHKLMFSMPPGTPPDKVLGAVRNFAREEFWGQHRYALVLHTDEAHPHVHLVLKALSEEGVRLHIKKATLRRWRSEFARNLRFLGVEANATERAVRGQMLKSSKDGIYRANLRADSTWVRAQTERVAVDPLNHNDLSEPGKRTLELTRFKIEIGWRTLADNLYKTGHQGLATDIDRFVAGLPKPATEKEVVAAKKAELTRARDHTVSR